MKKKLAALAAVGAILLSTAVVFAKGGKSDTCFVPGTYATIQEAINDGDGTECSRILVGPGEFAGALVDRPVEIKGVGGTVINSGPMHPAGLSMGFRFLEGSTGSAVEHLRFEVDLAIMNGGAVDDVNVVHNDFYNSIQAVSNWVGSGWEISHNKIENLRTRNGGGIGILIADYTGGEAKGNVVSHNEIFGTLFVSEGDGGGYDGSGVVLYADFRWGGAGATEISGNRVVNNSVSLESDTPGVVDVNAFEMTDTRDNITAVSYPVIFDNVIGFNDFRGTENQIVLTPLDLGNWNEISRNLGDNRGHGLHPSLFGPGGN